MCKIGMMIWVSWVATLCLWMIVVPVRAANVVYYQVQGDDITARYTDTQANTLVGSSAWHKIVGMAVHEARSKLYWSDGNFIWQSNVDGTNKLVFLGAVAQVSWSGHHFGPPGSPLTLTVLSQRCVTILSRTPTEVTCVLRVASLLDPSALQPIATTSVSIASEFGTATGITPGADDLLGLAGYKSPIVKGVTIQVTFPSPHALAVDNIVASSPWLFMSDPKHGRVYQLHVDDASVRVVVAQEWSVQGLSIYGSKLRYTVQSKGAIYALDVSNATSSSAIPTPLVTKLKSPRGIVLDHVNWRLYVAEKGGKIYRVHADGLPFPSMGQRKMVTMERVLGLSTLTRLNGLSLDVPNGVLYWTECSSTNVVARADLSTMERQVVAGGSPDNLNWPRYVHYASQSDALFYAEYGGRISSGPIGGPFDAVVDDVPGATVNSNSMDHRPMHMFALD
ncbi:hypothetical protein H257_17181 [Aphanomyces astaci]|uniref:DUF5050 domain-containing protein n=1 Tax=Aphanomyces astaci TaxID=112090 RepID=W4FI25_APHAT|nr:hypothetical protein H257_17181 [Aphanomyces astaci]ETV66403.1 hypothetical protein H257_17181 [Aphanomyces astaci]|eukprot:XP_009844178.1 hypothetical protein H257_17181 [Aphanomyces astaci]